MFRACECRICWTYLDEAEAHLGRDDLEQDETALATALAIETSPVDGSSTIDKLRATAITRLRADNYEAALFAADGISEMIARQPPTGYHWVDFYASAVEVYLELLALNVPLQCGRPALLKRARTGCKRQSRLSRYFWNVKARAATLAGWFAALQGDHTTAAQRLRAAIDTATQMQMPFELALPRMRALQMLSEPATAFVTASECAEVERIFTRFDAHYWLRVLRKKIESNPPL
jgi:hypothetical protein